MFILLPEPDFEVSAKLLDDKTLSVMRMNVMNVACALIEDTTEVMEGMKPWADMWAGCPEALLLYGQTICDEWKARWAEPGRLDAVWSCLSELGTLVCDDTPIESLSQEYLDLHDALPTWVGDHSVHNTHRSALLRRDPEHYRNIYPIVRDDLSLAWS